VLARLHEPLDAVAQSVVLAARGVEIRRTLIGRQVERRRRRVFDLEPTFVLRHVPYPADGRYADIAMERYGAIARVSRVSF
jgi:hypothetical protein